MDLSKQPEDPKHHETVTSVVGFYEPQHPRFAWTNEQCDAMLTNSLHVWQYWNRAAKSSLSESDDLPNL